MSNNICKPLFWRYLLLFPLLLLSAFNVCVAAAEPSARVMLDRMSHSYRELNYRGTFSFQQGESIQSLRMAHAVINGEEYERLEHMDGDPREIIRRGHDLTCIHPGHNLVRFYQQQSRQQQKGIDSYYRFSLAGTTRVAGLKAVILNISPKDTHRYGYRLALDEKTGLMLRSELIGPEAIVLERFQFVELTFGEALGAEYFSDAEHSYAVHHHSPEQRSPVLSNSKFNNPKLNTGDPLPAANQSWVVNWVPGGFTALLTDKKIVADDMATFTDGLTVFSVFLDGNVDSQKLRAGLEGRAQKGATTAYSRALLLAGKPHRVTVVGEIPSETARLIAQSVSLLK